jgi:small subunit ribosomal protein S20
LEEKALANRRNAIKKIRSDAKKTAHNKSVVSTLRTVRKNLETALAAKNAAQAKDLSKLYFSKLDKALKRGILKENTVSRLKSRLSIRINHASS